MKTQDPEQVDVFAAGADGVHSYRIPALLVSPAGTLLAFCEARKTSTHDASPTDLVLKRSTDNGRTWGPLMIALAGRGEEAIMNPCPVVDGRTVVLFCINAHKTARNHHRHLVLRSGDDGQTWSEPLDVTDNTVDGDDTFVPGPGVGIRLRSGRLVIPGYSNEMAADGTRLASWARAMISDDGGRTWRLGQRADYPWSCESQVVELGDGSLLLNWRIQKGDAEHPGCRGTAISRDGGESWSEPRLDRRLNEAPCQAGLVRCNLEGRNLILFSNPDSAPGPHGVARTKMTMRMSEDEGRTWPVSRLVHAGPSAYSCPAALPDGTIGLLYEGGPVFRYECIRFARFGLSWLSGNDGTL